MRTPGVQCVINSRCTSPAPEPGGFRLRLRAKRNTVQRSSMMGIRPWGFAKGGVAMLMLGFKQGSASNRRAGGGDPKTGSGPVLPRC
jgi:hypothetical protein